MIASSPVYEVAPHTDADALRVLVVGVGNVLRQDDAFGIAVVQHLAMRGDLPAGLRLLESGIAGIRLVQELMEGYDALIIVDAMVRKGVAGTVSLLEADVPDPRELPFDARGRYNTVAGLLMAVSGRLPGVAEHIEAVGWDFEVLDLDGRRIDKVLARRLPARSQLQTAHASA